MAGCLDALLYSNLEYHISLIRGFRNQRLGIHTLIGLMISAAKPYVNMYFVSYVICI